MGWTMKDLTNRNFQNLNTPPVDPRNDMNLDQFQQATGIKEKLQSWDDLLDWFVAKGKYASTITVDGILERCRSAHGFERHGHVRHVESKVADEESFFAYCGQQILLPSK